MSPQHALAAEIRRRLGPAPEAAEWPLVSIVVVNRDGAHHLRRLLTGLAWRTDYPRLELIVVDNGSSDDSMALLRRAETGFPVAVVANRHNESFSDACNQGAQLARGELLLFLNNDIEPFERGWLRELVCCLRGQPGIAAATLLRPAPGARWGHLVQHRAIPLAEQDDGTLGPDRRSYDTEPLGDGFGEDAESPVAPGACMLIGRDLFRRVGGFTHGYVYGGEDIDLGLKVWAADGGVLCSGRSLLIHRLGSTRTQEDAERRRKLATGNRRLFCEYWAARLRREYELDRLAGDGGWAAPGEDAAAAPSREEALAPGFCLKSSEPVAAGRGEDPLARLREALGRRGHRCAVLRGERIDDLDGLEYDVAVHLAGPARYVLGRAQLNVLWVPDDARDTPAAELRRYDLVWTGGDAGGLIEASLTQAERLALPLRIRST